MKKNNNGKKTTPKPKPVVKTAKPKTAKMIKNG